MNASGTLDPLAARDAGLAIDRELALRRHQDRDAAARARATRRRACARSTGGMLNSIGLPNPGLDGVRRDDAAGGARARPPARRLGRRLRARRLRARLPAARRRAGHRGARAQRLLPERQERLHLDRQRPRRDRGRRAPLPCGDAAAAVGQALAQRGRPRRDRARGRARRRRRARAHEHAARARDRPLDAAPAARRGHGRALRARRSSRWRWRPCTPAARPARLPIVGVGGIASGWDALEFLAAGASAVQVGQRRVPRAAARPSRP